MNNCQPGCLRSLNRAPAQPKDKRTLCENTPHRFRYHNLVPPTPAAPVGEIRGAALHENGILTWGESLALWPFDGKPPRVLESGTNYGPAGTLDRQLGLFLLEDGRRLIRHRPRLVIEEETATRDLLPATLHGRRGLLYIHLHSQLRFWTPAGTEEIYSIYTPSHQAGLQFADLDGDGRPELLCGNYWLKPSEKRGVAWRLFAINTFFERENSASARLLYLQEPRGLLWASSERVAWLTPSPDLRQLWQPNILPLEGAGNPTCWLESPLLLMGHENGVHSFRWDGTSWRTRPYAQGFSCVALLARNGSVWAVAADRPRLIYPLR